jgi:hypothetical protein
MQPMTEFTILAGCAMFVLGLLTLRALNRAAKKRHATGRSILPRWLRILVALLALAAVIAGPVVMIKAVIYKANKNQRLAEELAKSGTSAVATILDLAETGTYYNERPEMQVLLNVKPDGAPSFAATVEMVFLVQDVQRYGVGADVRVLFDPKDHDRVAIVGLARSAP